MKIHEYQAKQILQEFGIPVPFGHVASTPDEAEKIAQKINGKVVLKAQIHAGGRGKAGGVRFATEPVGARTLCREMLARRLVTPQTGPDGVSVRKVLVEKALDVSKEFYLAVTLNRSMAAPVVLASESGGMEIETLLTSHPKKIHHFPVDPAVGGGPRHMGECYCNGPKF